MTRLGLLNHDKKTTDALRIEFKVMGNTAKVTVIGGSHHHLEFARERLLQLDQTWSRFRPTSDIYLLNSSLSRPVKVHADTIGLVKLMINGFLLTNGLFDPTVLPAIVANGYQSSRTNNSLVTILPDGAKFGQPLDLVVIDETSCTITLPIGTTIDPGAIGKGLAADLVATELMQQDISGVCVNVGGDVRCIGRGDIEGQWIVGIESPFESEQIVDQVRLLDGAVATSSVVAKTWQHQGLNYHHVFDPLTGLPRTTGDRSILQVSVVASECAWAEMFATTLLVADIGAGFGMIDDNSIAALAICADERLFRSSRWLNYN